MVTSGGVLVFCTCSLDPREGNDQIENFLAAHKDFSREVIRPDEVGGLGALVTARGDLRTLPSHLADQGGMDGFFSARLRRKA
jgi:16S rRNA (cytosine967-C5)-methyltransferase